MNSKMEDVLNCVACGSRPTVQPLFQCEEGHLLCQKDGQILQSCPAPPISASSAGGDRGDGVVDVCGAPLLQIRLQWIQYLIDHPEILDGWKDKAANHLEPKHPDKPGIIATELDKQSGSSTLDLDLDHPPAAGADVDNNDPAAEDKSLSPEPQPPLDIEEDPILDAEVEEIFQNSTPPPLSDDPSPSPSPLPSPLPPPKRPTSAKSCPLPALLLQRLELLGTAASSLPRQSWAPPPSPEWHGTASLALSTPTVVAPPTTALASTSTQETLPFKKKIVQEWESAQKSLQTLELASATPIKEEQVLLISTPRPGSLYYRRHRRQYSPESLAEMSSAFIRATQEAEMLAKRATNPDPFPDIWYPPQNLSPEEVEAARIAELARRHAQMYSIHEGKKVVSPPLDRFSEENGYGYGPNLSEARLGELYRLDDDEIQFYFENKGRIDKDPERWVETFRKNRRRIPVSAFVRELGKIRERSDAGKRYQVYALSPEFDEDGKRVGLVLPGFITQRSFWER